MNKYLNRRCLYIFVITFICLSLVSGIAATAGYVTRIENNKAGYEAMMAQDTARVLEYAGQHFNTAISGGNLIFAEKWYNHYRNVAGVYADEFTEVRKMEIQQEIGTKVAMLPLVEDILIITPSMDSIICKNGWLTIERYSDLYGPISVTNEGGYLQSPVVTIDNDEYVWITLQDTTVRREKSVICVLFSRKKFESALENIMPSTAVALNASLGDRVICSIGDMSGDVSVIKRQTVFPEFELTIGFQGFQMAAGNDARREYLLTMALILSVCLILAALVAGITNKPLTEMILSFGGQSKDLDNPYQFIYDYVNTYSRHAEYLKMRVDHMGVARERFFDLMRNEIFLGMLTNPNFNFDDEYIGTQLPWINGGHPCLMVAMEAVREGARVGVDVGALSGGASHATQTDIFGARCVLLWYDGVQAAEAARERIATEYGADRRLFIALSEVLNEPEEFHAAYVQLRSEIEDKRRAREELPVSVQIALADAIRRRSLDSCMEALGAFIEGDRMDAPMLFLMRSALEAGLNVDELQAQFYGAADATQRRTALLATISALMDDVPADTAPRVHDDSSEQIVEYIRQHYCDPELSVAQLADQFKLHRTLISKAVKSATGATFSELLQTLRLNRAVELLLHGDATLAEIAQATGYASYLSFKRAFMRVYGVSPRDYRVHAVYTEGGNGDQLVK